MDIPAALKHIVDGQDLSQEQATQVFHTIMSGAGTPAQIGALLAALRVKGETAEEIAGAAMTMRELSTKVEVDVPHLVDTRHRWQRPQVIQYFHCCRIRGCCGRRPCCETRQP